MAFSVGTVLFLGLSSFVFAETVYLRSGNIVTGKILVKKARVTVLDIGFTVLEIPNDRILKVEKAEPEEDSGNGSEEVLSGKTLYTEAKRSKKPVQDLVAEFGEGVVLVRTPSGMGSGFLIHPQGYLITNAHVIERETNISVTLFLQGEERLTRRKIKKVEIVALNPFADLALLKLVPPEDLKLTCLSFGDMDRVRTGDQTFAVGNPLGFERSVSEGIISSKARAFQGMVLLQTTAPINPGNSGGPLLNMRGEVIGVTNMKMGFLSEGMGFAIPVNFVKDFLKFRDAFAYDKDNPNTGHHYLEPPNESEKGDSDAKDEKVQPG